MKAECIYLPSLPNNHVANPVFVWHAKKNQKQRQSFYRLSQHSNKMLTISISVCVEVHGTELGSIYYNTFMFSAMMLLKLFWKMLEKSH